MINVEDELFTELAAMLRGKFDGISVYPEEPEKVAKFPCVTIEEMDNYSYRRTADSGSIENHVVVVFAVNVYSNKATGKKEECKKILSEVDEAFLSMGFTRRMKNHVTMTDATICRMIARYEGVVSKNMKIYGR